MLERAEDMTSTIDSLVEFLASSKIMDQPVMSIPAAAQMVNNTMMAVFSEIGALGGSVGAQCDALRMLCAKAADTVDKACPPIYDVVARLVDDVVKWKMQATFADKPGLADLIAHRVTPTLLHNIRASLVLHIVTGLGLQSVNIRNGPVCEARPYLQPLQHKLCAASLERFSPNGRWLQVGLPDDMLQIAEKNGTFGFQEVGEGELSASKGLRGGQGERVEGEMEGGRKSNIEGEWRGRQGEAGEDEGGGRGRWSGKRMMRRAMRKTRR